jgi:hypothetical protein
MEDLADSGLIEPAKHDEMHRRVDEHLEDWPVL